jgi:glycine/D-amino acid oxidase-like deaminating enzyme
MDLRTGFAYWLVRNGLLTTYSPLDNNETADVTILGGGITGALAAYELSHAGANVVVVDKRDVAGGSSAATTGLLLCETDTSLLELSERVGERAAARVYHLGREAISRIESLTISLADSCGFARRSSLYLASTSGDARMLEREYALRRAHGLGVALLDAGEIHRKWGIDAPAALYSHGGEIDCYRFAHRLLAGSVRRGARIYARTAVERLDVEDGERMTVVTAGSHRIRTRWVVAATGYEAVEHMRPPQTVLSSTWVVASEPLRSGTPWAERSLIWETARPYLYARTTDDNRIIVGGEDEPYAEGHQDRDLLNRKTARLSSRLNELFPQLRPDVAYAWAGTFGSTVDGLPLIGPSPGNPRLWFALGYGGNGITFSVIAARLLVDAYLGRQTPDARIFALDRRSVADAERVPDVSQRPEAAPSVTALRSPSP